MSVTDATVAIRQNPGADRPIDVEQKLIDGTTVYRQRVATNSRFARLLTFTPEDGEELRRDETSTDDYHGAAVDGSAESDVVWDVVRFYKTTGLITRVRFREGIRWDQRTAGW